ncbi:tetratricopeptide repeat protein [Henriciella litoralis]|uniref:tetratricopeptide repeat protein n=1 Tax=Henriciella litoralis TaxID=568102 RepID=UPI000A0410BF|nr:tetratricopeptide repeat protein [Henriciella litoralis]
MTRPTIIMLACALVLSVGAYLWLGSPFLEEQPYASREAEIAAKPASELSPPEMLARLQMTAREQPDAAEPQYYIGVLMKTQGQTEDALRAFQSALRRNPDHVPSLMGLADAVVIRDGGVVTEPSARLYDRAWRLDPTQIRAGILSAVPAYEAGDTEAAEAHWAKVAKDLEPGDPRLAMMDALRGDAVVPPDAPEDETVPPADESESPAED